MTRTIIALISLALSAPLAAHEGIALDSPLHDLLHRYGTGTVLGLSGMAVAIAAVLVLRRRTRGRAAIPADTVR